MSEAFLFKYSTTQVQHRTVMLESRLLAALVSSGARSKSTSVKA